MSEPIPDIEKTEGFSISKMDPWDFWSRVSNLGIPENVSVETISQIASMKAIQLRDMSAPSERRN